MMWFFLMLAVVAIGVVGVAYFPAPAADHPDAIAESFTIIEDN